MYRFRTYSIYDATVEEWTSILKLAQKWDFIEVKAMAIRELEKHKIPALQKIVLYQKYEVDRKHLQEAFTELTVRDEPITIEEGRELGLETVLQLARAREIARIPVFGGGKRRPPVNIPAVEMDALIRDIFQARSTGRGTPTAGRDSSQTLGTQTNGQIPSQSNLPQQGRSSTGLLDDFFDTVLT
jgi:hypothetical protein